MKLVDELYEMYKDKLTGDEEDAEIIALSVLEQLDRSEVVELLEELKDEELYYLVGHYMVERLKAKMANEGIGRTKISNMEDMRTLH